MLGYPCVYTSIYVHECRCVPNHTETHFCAHMEAKKLLVSCTPTHSPAPMPTPTCRFCLLDSSAHTQLADTVGNLATMHALALRGGRMSNVNTFAPSVAHMSTMHALALMPTSSKTQPQEGPTSAASVASKATMLPHARKLPHHSGLQGASTHAAAVGSLGTIAALAPQQQKQPTQQQQQPRLGRSQRKRRRRRRPRSSTSTSVSHGQH